MNSSKTYTILQSFDKYEINRIRKFLESPYFNSNQAIIDLFEIIIKNISSTKEKELEKEQVWEKIYKEKKFDDVRFRKLNSELLKLVEQFLAQQIYEENPIRQAVHLMEAVGNKKLSKLNNSTLRTARRLSSQQDYKPANFYFYQYAIEKNFYELNQLSEKRNEKSNEDEIAINLDCFYLAEKLRLYCHVLVRKRHATAEYNILFIDEIIENITKYQYDNYPPVAIYLQIYYTLSEFENEEHYFKLKQLLDKFSKEFPLEEAYSMYSFATNYCVSKINRGQQKFLREYFDLNKTLLHKELIFNDGELSPWMFKNIIVIGLRLGEFDWIESFINNYKERIPANYRDNAVTFNLAQLYFYKKEYDKVIRLLHQVEYEDPAYNLNSKTMLIATYYETDEIEPLYHLFESFRVYLNRNKKIAHDKKKRYLNLIKYTKKLTKLIPGDKKTLAKIKKEVEETKAIINTKWLMEKIAELER